MARMQRESKTEVNFITNQRYFSFYDKILPAIRFLQVFVIFDNIKCTSD